MFDLGKECLCARSRAPQLFHSAILDRRTWRTWRTLRTWKRWKTTFRWLKTLYLLFKTLYLVIKTLHLLIKTLYLSTRRLKKLYFTAFMATVENTDHTCSLREHDPGSVQNGSTSSKMWSPDSRIVEGYKIPWLHTRSTSATINEQQTFGKLVDRPFTLHRSKE